MFGYGTHRTKRAADSVAERHSRQAAELDRAITGVRTAVLERRVRVFVVVVLLMLGCVPVLSAIASAISVGWDLSADVPWGRYTNRTALWVILGLNLVLTLLAGGGALALLVSMHRDLRAARATLARFYADHHTEINTIAPIRDEALRSDAAIDAQVRRKRARLRLLSTTDLAATVPSPLLAEVRGLIDGIAGAKIKRRVGYLLGPVYIGVGILAITLGVIPAHEAGWQMGADTPAGRLDGSLPLWMVVAVGVILGLLMLAGGVSQLLGGFAAVRSAENRLVRFRIVNKAALSRAGTTARRGASR